MSSPNPSTAIQRPDLAATMEQIDLDASREGFVGLQLFPVVEVGEQSANIGRIKLEQLLSDASTSRNSKGGYNRGEYEFDEFFYATSDHGWEEPVDDRLRRIYRRYFDAESVAARRARDRVLRNFERRIVEKVTGTGITGVAAGGGVWSAKATATPVADVLAAQIALRDQCGLLANTVAMDWEAFMRARETAEVIDRLKYAGFDDPKNVSANALAQLFNVDRVVISGGQRNTANQAKARSLSSLWPKGIVLVAHTATDNDVQKPALGRTFHWSEDGSEMGAVIESYREEGVRGDVIRARMESDERLIYAECGRRITGVLA